MRQPFIITLSAILLFAGCATHDDGGGMEVSLVNISGGTGGGLGEAALSCEVRLQNGSPEALTVEGGRHRVYLNGIYIGEGLSNETVEVPRLGTATQRLNVYLSTLRMAGSMVKIYEEHKADYRLESTLYTRHNGHAHSIKVVRTGTLNMEALAQPTTIQPTLRP